MNKYLVHIAGVNGGLAKNDAVMADKADVWGDHYVLSNVIGIDDDGHIDTCQVAIFTPTPGSYVMLWPEDE